MKYKNFEDRIKSIVKKNEEDNKKAGFKLVNSHLMGITPVYFN